MAAASFVFFVLGVLIYFIPAIVGKHKRNATAILVLNIFLGWTVIGWVVALVWACSTEDAPAATRRGELPLPTVPCFHCGSANAYGARRCVNCSVQFVATVDPPPTEK